MHKKGLNLFLYTVVYACGNNQGHYDVYVAYILGYVPFTLTWKWFIIAKNKYRTHYSLEEQTAYKPTKKEKNYKIILYFSFR